MKIMIERNSSINIEDLNNLLATNNWDIKPINKLKQSLDLSWGWVCAKDV